MKVDKYSKLESGKECEREVQSIRPELYQPDFTENHNAQTSYEKKNKHKTFFSVFLEVNYGSDTIEIFDRKQNFWTKYTFCRARRGESIGDIFLANFQIQNFQYNFPNIRAKKIKV